MLLGLDHGLRSTGASAWPSQLAQWLDGGGSGNRQGDVLAARPAAQVRGGGAL